MFSKSIGPGMAPAVGRGATPRAARGHATVSTTKCGLLDEENDAANERERTGRTWNLVARRANGERKPPVRLHETRWRTRHPRPDVELDRLRLGPVIQKGTGQQQIQTRATDIRRVVCCCRGPWIAGLMVLAATAGLVGGRDLDTHTTIRLQAQHEPLRRSEPGQESHREAQPGDHALERGHHGKEEPRCIGDSCQFLEARRWYGTPTSFLTYITRPQSWRCPGLWGPVALSLRVTSKGKAVSLSTPMFRFRTGAPGRNE